MVLILFSTIGFNIVSTFCGGCDIEHTSVLIVPIINEADCECCAGANEQEVCSCLNDAHENTQHKTKTTLAQLKFDSPEAKSELFKVDVPVHFLPLIVAFLQVNYLHFNITIQPRIDFSPPLTGRTILSLICVLLN